MNNVWPEPDESCTIPGTRPRAEDFSASTGRPPRSVTKSSCRCSASAGSRAILRSRSASLPRPSRSSRRKRRRAGEAESFRSDPSSSTERPISSATESSDGSMRLDNREERRQVAALRNRAVRRHAGADRALDLREAPRVERAAARRQIGSLAHVGCAAELGLGGFVEQRDRLGRLLLAEPHLAGVARRAQRFRQGRSRIARRRSGEPGQDGRKLEELQVMLTHAASVEAGGASLPANSTSGRRSDRPRERSR